jgi:hypothetical protein
VSPAGLASVADDRTLNTWRNELQAHLLLTTHETSLNKAVIEIGKILGRCSSVWASGGNGNTEGIEPIYIAQVPYRLSRE